MGFIPLYSLFIPETPTITSISFNHQRIYLATSEGVIFVDGNPLLKIKGVPLRMCAREDRIWILSSNKLIEVDTLGKIENTYNLPIMANSMKCLNEKVYISFENKVAEFRRGFSPRIVFEVGEEISDFVLLDDTLIILSQSLLSFYQKDSILNVYSISEGIKVERFKKLLFILNDRGEIWIFKDGKRILDGVIDFDLKHDTLVILRRERFGRFVNVLKILNR